MKALKASVLLLLMTSIGILAHAQRIKTIEGNADVLKNERNINVEFAYDHMRVGKFDKEEDYVKSKKEEYNNKESGRGDNWAKAWEGDRQFRFEPQFIEHFEKFSELSNKKEAKYTLIFHTTFTEPGFNIGIVKKSALIDAEVWIVETANKATPIAKISVQKAPGRSFWGNDYDTGERLAEAYATAGKYLGKYLKK